MLKITQSGIASALHGIPALSYWNYLHKSTELISDDFYDPVRMGFLTTETP